MNNSYNNYLMKIEEDLSELLKQGYDIHGKYKFITGTPSDDIKSLCLRHYIFASAHGIFDERWLIEKIWLEAAVSSNSAP